MLRSIVLWERKVSNKVLQIAKCVSQLKGLFKGSIKFFYRL